MSAHQFARDHIGKAVERQKKGYNARAKERDELKIGSHVRYYYPPEKQKSKFARPWLGPYEVVQKVTDVNYRIKEVANPDKTRVVHFDSLKPYESDPASQPDIPEVMELIDGGWDLGLEELWDFVVPDLTKQKRIPQSRGAKPQASGGSLNPEGVHRRRQRRRRSPDRWTYPTDQKKRGE